MFDLFKNKISNSWGLHITDRHLRAIKLTGEKLNWGIEKIGKINLPPGTCENSLIKNSPVFQEAVYQLCAKTFPSPLKSPYVIVNLAEEHAFSRIIQTPPLEKNEMDEAIKWEAESNIPLPIEKVYLAWEILEKPARPGGGKENNKNLILLTATTKNIVDDLIKNLKLAGLLPVMIEPESAALVRSLTQTGSLPELQSPVLILNLREHCTHIITFDLRVIALSATTENSSAGFDDAISNTFKIKKEDAERYRQKIGWNEKEELGIKMIEATSVPFNAIKREVGTAISFYRNKSGKEIKEILLTGEKCSKWPGFDQFLQKEIALPVKWQKDWNPSVWPPNCPFVAPGKEEYNVSIGLALRKFEEDQQ